MTPLFSNKLFTSYCNVQPVLWIKMYYITKTITKMLYCVEKWKWRKKHHENVLIKVKTRHLHIYKVIFIYIYIKSNLCRLLHFLLHCFEQSALLQTNKLAEIWSCIHCFTALMTLPTGLKSPKTTSLNSTTDSFSPCVAIAAPMIKCEWCTQPHTQCNKWPHNCLRTVLLQ